MYDASATGGEGEKELGDTTLRFSLTLSFLFLQPSSALDATTDTSMLFRLDISLPPTDISYFLSFFSFTKLVAEGPFYLLPLDSEVAHISTLFFWNSLEKKRAT